MASVGKGLVGLLLGVAGGAAAAVLLAPRRKPSGATATGAATVLDAALDGVEAVVEGVQSVVRLVRPDAENGGLLPDERITARVQSELERRGLATDRLDVSTVD